MAPMYITAGGGCRFYALRVLIQDKKRANSDQSTFCQWGRECGEGGARGGGGGDLVPIMPVCVCRKVKDMGPFSASSE